MSLKLQTQGALGAAQAAVTVRTIDATNVAVQLLSGLTGTVTFEVTVDGSTWVATEATPAAGGAVVTTATATGAWRVSVGGFTQFRVRCSAYTSGSAICHVATAHN
jgi:hypothetical protein